MADADVISAREALELFSYDAATGMVTRKVKRGGRALAGAQVGSDDMHGYKTVRINRRSYKVHRLVWLMTHGVWPAGDVDHINGDRSDNRLCNLRDVPRAVNLQNQTKAPNNKSTGVLGVYRDGASFYSRISVANKSIHLGTFPTIEEARRAYVKAKRELHPGATL